MIDKRFLRPSKRRLPPGQLEQFLQLYRERYTGFNVRHFHQIAKREHGVTASYSFVKQALQAAGLVKKFRARGRHRQRREPRACFGEMLHLDGSVHGWFTGDPEARPCLILVSDDATKRAVLVDPGDEAERILEAVDATGCTLQAIWLTHAHFDAGTPFLCR